MMLEGVLACGKKSYFFKKILQPQHGPNALIQRMFITNHDRNPGRDWNRMGCCDIAS